MAAWWRPEDEPPPQSRIGTSRPAGPSPPPRRSFPRRSFPWPTVIAVLAAVGLVGFFTFVTFTAFRGVGDVGGTPDIGGGGSHDGPSLIRPDRLERALAKVRAEGGSEGSLVAFRLDPERLSAVIRRGDGSRAVVVVYADLDTDVLPAGAGGDFGLSLNRIDPRVPDRLARAAAERLGRRAADVGYLALTSTPGYGGGGAWSVFFTHGGSDPPVTADLDGSNIRVPGR